MIKDFSKIPAIKKVINTTEDVIKFNVGNIQVSTNPGDEVKLILKTSSDLAVLNKRMEEFGVTVEDDSSVPASTPEELAELIDNPEISEITLTEDMTLSATKVIDRDLTIDLGGNVITCNEKAFSAEGNANLVLDNGKFVATGSNYPVRCGVQKHSADNHPTVTLGKDLEIESNWYGACVFGPNSTLNVYGTIDVTSDGYGISGNGNAGNGGTTINVYDGAVIRANSKGSAFYLPQDGVLNIYGGDYEGDSVVLVKSGTVNVMGGKLHATGPKVEMPSPSFDGKEPTGDTIGVEVNNKYTGGKEDKNIKINVTGGELISDNAYIIREVNINNSDITIEVTGEYFNKETIAEGVNIYTK